MVAVLKIVALLLVACYLVVAGAAEIVTGGDVVWGLVALALSAVVLDDLRVAGNRRQQWEREAEQKERLRAIIRAHEDAENREAQA